MTETTQYLTGLGISLLISLAVVIYLRPHLRNILLELCGARERAAFWVAFSNVALCLFPLIFAIYRWPEPHAGSQAARELGEQVGAALIGLLAAVITLGIVVSGSIRAYEARLAARART